jgi:hypothetical protein
LNAGAATVEVVVDGAGPGTVEVVVEVAGPGSVAFPPLGEHATSMIAVVTRARLATGPMYSVFAEAQGAVTWNGLRE